MDGTLISQAAETLRQGRLVAFPTETVYGLGADARNDGALKRIFEVKGRPISHPLIVHVAEYRTIKDWCRDVPPESVKLAERFWPGPLTLVFKKDPGVLDQVTGGQDTVALRIPRHPVALALLKEFKGGVAAPSANRFGKVSPTTADHVRQDLGSEVDVILDGGPCTVGVESTILDLSSGRPVILRPGGVTREDLQKALGREIPLRAVETPRTPGHLESHYAPRARVVAVPARETGAHAEDLRSKGQRVAVLTAAEVSPERLYGSLRKADGTGVDVIVVPLPREEGLGLAVADRLRKASGPRNS